VKHICFFYCLILVEVQLLLIIIKSEVVSQLKGEF